MSINKTNVADILNDKRLLDELGLSQEECEALVAGGDLTRLWNLVREKKKRGRDTGKRKPSILSDDTENMGRRRRDLEQKGHRKLARVHAREHHQRVEDKQAGLEMQSGALQHPALDNQRFDGIDPNLNPEPALNTDARREFDNARREQEMEKQLRLGNMPSFSTAPKPQGP